MRTAEEMKKDPNNAEKVIPIDKLAMLCVMQETYRNLYENSCIVGISAKYIHIQADAFLATFKDYERTDMGEFTELSADCAGVKFICLVGEEAEDES